MSELSDKSPNFVQAIETRLLIERMKQMAVGDTLEYSEIESITGRKLVRARSALDTARSSLLKTDGMVFGTITKVGIKRLADDEIVNSSVTTEKRIGRMSRREIKRLSCANYNALSQDQKVTHNARMTVFAMAADISSAASVRKIEGAVKDSGSAIPSAKAAVIALSSIA